MNDIPFGHNNPPTQAQLTAEEMKAALAPFEERKAAILARMPAVIVNDADSAGAAADMAGLIKALTDAVDKERAKIAAPLRDAADAAGNVAMRFNEDLAEARREIWRRVNKFREDMRVKAVKAAEEQHAIEAERAAAAAAREGIPAPTFVAPAAPVERAPTIRGDLGGKVGDRRQLVITIEDYSKIPEFILQSEKVTEAIISTVRSMAQSGAVIPGIKTERPLTTSIT